MNNTETMKRNGFAPILILLVVGLIIAVGVDIFLRIKEPQQQTIVPTPREENVTQVTPTPTSSASTRSEYSNGVIRFQYPIGWKLSETSTGFIIQPPFLKAGETFPAITLNTIDNPDDLSVQGYNDFVASGGMNPNLISALAEERHYGGIPGYYLSHLNCEPLTCDKYSLSYHKKIYVFTSVYASESEPVSEAHQQEMQSVFVAMLTSLSFNK